MDTLAKLHATMGTKFKIPVIAGRELDLHRFFTEVTYRGGIDKAIKDRKWREIIASFNLPSTATNASFVLRKYYMSLLFHYEKMYFFGSQGWNSPPSVSSNMPSTSVPSERSSDPVPQQSSRRSGRKRRGNGEAAPPGSNKHVTGVIDGKFDNGYFVTIMVGTEKMKGVLYHIPQNTADQESTLPGFADNSDDVMVGRRRKRGPTNPRRKRRNSEKAERREKGHNMYDSALVISNAVPIRQLPMIDANCIMETDEAELYPVNGNDSSESSSMESDDSELDTETASLDAGIFS